MFEVGHNRKIRRKLLKSKDLVKFFEPKFFYACYICSRMITKEIAREVSRKTGMSSEEAAHQVDRVVRDILKKLHSGQSANLPGVGRLIAGVTGRIRFRKEKT
jgi:hypothetical protein